CSCYLSVFSDTAAPDTYTLSLHDALPISLDKTAIKSTPLTSHRADPMEMVRTKMKEVFNKQKPVQVGSDTVGMTQLLTTIAKAGDRKSTRLNSSHVSISYAVFCLKKKI